MMAKQLLETYFKKEEIPEVQRKIEADKNFKDTFEKVKKRQIDISLDNLQARVDKTKSSFEERFEAFKKAVLEAEKKQKPWVVEVAEKKAKEILEEKKKELDKKLRAQANKKIPFIWEFFYDLAKDWVKEPGEDAWIFDKIFWKIWKYIWMAILWYLWVKKWVEEMQNLKVEKTWGKEDDKKKAGDKKENKEEEEKGKETNEKENNFYYKTWIISLLHLSGIDSKIDIKSSLNKFEWKTLKELEEIKKSWKMNWKELTDEDKKFLDVLFSKNSKILLKSSLKPEILKKTLEKNKEKLKKLLAWEYNDIEKALNEWTFKIENLSLKAISILSLFSINSFWLLAIEWIKSNFEWVFDFLNDTTNIKFDEIKKDLEQKRNSIISEELLKALTQNPHFTFYKKKANSNDSELREYLKDFKNKEELEKFINFKNWLLWKEFLWKDSKTLLWKFNKSEKFKENLTYAWVIALYTILWWEQNLENLSIIDLPVLYKTISIILWRRNAALKSDYITDVIWYYAKWDEDNIFKDPNDKEALKIITETLVEDYSKFIIRQIQEKLGYVWLMKWEYLNDVSAILVGLWLKKVWWKMMKKWLIFKWSFVKKLWYLALISWIASAIHTTYNKGSELFKELSEFKDKNYSEMSDSELKNFIEKAENLNKRMITKEIEINWKKEKFLLFSSKNWLEIIYNNKIYKLWIWFSRFWDLKQIWNTIMRSLWWESVDIFNKYLKDELPGEISEYIVSKKDIESYWNNTEMEFKWKKYNFSKIEIKGNEIIIWEWENILKLSLETFLKKVALANDLHPEKLYSTESNEKISYKIIENWYDDEHNLIIIQQWVLKS